MTDAACIPSSIPATGPDCQGPACSYPYICTASNADSGKIGLKVSGAAAVLHGIEHRSEGPVSLNDPPYLLHVYYRDLKVKKFFPQAVPPPSGLKSKIFRFSDDSRRNLLHVCRNSGHHIQSQFCLTYHDSWPSDGKAAKAQLHHFITGLKRLQGCSQVHYLWVLEFQARSAPHFHFFTDIPAASPYWAGVPFLCPPAPVTASDLAHLWVVQVQGLHMPGCRETLQFHSHESNFFRWQMVSGKYLAKEYVEKSMQKDVPEDFQNVGRFWGNSRNMKPQFMVLDPYETEDPLLAGVIPRAIRSISKLREKQKEGRLQHVKTILRSKLQELRCEKGVEPEKVKAAEKRLQDFCRKIKSGVNFRGRKQSYTLILSSALFFQFMDSFNQVGQLFPKLSNYVPF